MTSLDSAEELENAMDDVDLDRLDGGDEEELEDEDEDLGDGDGCGINPASRHAAICLRKY